MKMTDKQTKTTHTNMTDWQT